MKIHINILYDNQYFRDVLFMPIIVREFPDKLRLTGIWYNRSNTRNPFCIGINQTFDVPNHKIQDWFPYQRGE